MAMTKQDWAKIAGVIIVIVIATAVFTFFYGKQVGESNDALAKQKLADRNKELLAKSRQDSVYIKLKTDTILNLVNQLKTKKVEYVQINSKYDKMHDLVKSMPADEQVKFLADWLSKSDSLSR